MIITTFLVLAHRDVQHLRELICALDGNRIIIHIDRKSEINHSTLIDLCQNSNVILIDKNHSINVKWGGFSQVRAMLILIQTALPLMSPREKMMFVSGSDFPIRSSKDITNFFSDVIETEYLRYYSLDNRKKDTSRWQSYHRWDFRIFKKRGSFLNRLNSLCIRIVTWFETLLRGPKSIPEFRLMAGSQWFAISKECAEEMLQLRSKNFDRFFKTMFAPDEVYFATLFAMSKFAKSNVDSGALICNSVSSRVFQARNLTYVDESLNKWLDMDDLDRIKNSNFLFARKFDSNISLELRSLLKEFYRN